MKNYRTAIVAIVEHEGKVLVGKKMKTKGHPLSEAWHIPGGSLEGNETEEQGLIREVMEEASIDIEVIKFFGETVVTETQRRARWYLCKPLTHDLCPGDDLTDVKYIQKDDIHTVCSEKANSLWPPEVAEYFNA